MVLRKGTADVEEFVFEYVEGCDKVDVVTEIPEEAEDMVLVALIGDEMVGDAVGVDPVGADVSGVGDGCGDGGGNGEVCPSMAHPVRASPPNCAETVGRVSRYCNSATGSVVLEGTYGYMKSE